MPAAFMGGTCRPPEVLWVRSLAITLGCRVRPLPTVIRTVWDSFPRSFGTIGAPFDKMEHFQGEGESGALSLFAGKKKSGEPCRPRA